MHKKAVRAAHMAVCMGLMSWGYEGGRNPSPFGCFVLSVQAWPVGHLH